VGPYRLLSPIGSGGFGQVFLGRHAGPHGFSRLVALKGLAAEKQDELEAVAMLIDEARIASRVQHPNVVQMLDVVEQASRIWLVMEHVHGETLARLIARTAERGEPIPQAVASGIACGVLRGLHAAHEATDPSGRPLGIVHRDVSPHNVIVSAHGVARVLDFGIAKAAGRLSVTRHGQLKGKLLYMAPEQLTVDPVDRRADVYAAAVLVSELYAGRRLIEPRDVQAALDRSSETDLGSLTELPVLRSIIARGLAKNPADRHPTAGAMADAIEACGPLASDREVAGWLRGLVGDELAARQLAWESNIEGTSQEPAHVPALSDATVSALVIAPPPTARGSDAAASIRVPVPPPPARYSSARWPMVVGASALAMAPVAIVILLRWGDGDAPAQSPSAAPAVETSISGSAMPTPSAVVPIDPPAISTTRPGVASASPTDIAPLGPRVDRLSVPGEGMHSSRPAPRDCDPPYKLDQRGVKVLKLECLR